jgi:hypothetical protein
LALPSGFLAGKSKTTVTEGATKTTGNNRSVGRSLKRSRKHAMNKVLLTGVALLGICGVAHAECSMDLDYRTTCTGGQVELNELNSLPHPEYLNRLGNMIARNIAAMESVHVLTPEEIKQGFTNHLLASGIDKEKAKSVIELAEAIKDICEKHKSACPGGGWPEGWVASPRVTQAPDTNTDDQLVECNGMFKEKYGTLEHWKDMCKTMITTNTFNTQKKYLYETLDKIIEMKKEAAQQ